jgi:hypothetical protein
MRRHTYVCLAKVEEEEEGAEEEEGERLLRNIMYPSGRTTPAIMMATPIRYLPGVGGSISIFFLLTTRQHQIRSAIFHVRITGECRGVNCLISSYSLIAMARRGRQKAI